MKVDLKELKEEFSHNLNLDYDLKKKNWFNIGGKAKIYFKAENLKDLIKFLKIIENKENIFVLGGGSNTLITDDKYDVIFADPPYDFKRIDEIHDIIFKRKLLRHHGLFVLEHAKNKNFTNSFNFMEQRTYSSVNFSFFGA